MSNYEKMFSYNGKTTKLIGPLRTKTYNEIYQYISEKQKNKELPFNGSYLGENELAKTIYEKPEKYFTSDLMEKIEEYAAAEFTYGGIPIEEELETEIEEEDV